MPLSPVITEAGLSAAIDASSKGISIQLSHIGLGDSGWTPDAQATQLHSEMRRVPIGSASQVNGQQLHVTAIEDGEEAYWIRELGFYLNDGTLFAVWSHNTRALAYKTAGVDVLLAFDLVISALPAGSLEVVGGGGFELPAASETVVGVVRFATDAEAVAGARNDVAMTPLGTRHHGDARYSLLNHAHLWGAIVDKPALFPSIPHGHNWDVITDKPTSFPPTAHTHAWGAISEKPSAFPPTSHSHTWAQIQGKPDRFPPAAHQHDNRYLVKSSMVFTHGMVATGRRHSGEEWPGHLTWYKNDASISPPAGYTIYHLRGFIPSIATIFFDGKVNNDDILYCRWRTVPDLNVVQVICANSENRGDQNNVGSYVNYLAIWQK